jgi:aryl-alcohol dehydrogenase-like predicted oxidoreductase
MNDTFTIGGDLTVNRLGFGAMRLTGKGVWGPPEDPAEARRVLKRALDLGVNFIDTADSYGPEVSEKLIGDTLFPYPAGLVIATKGGLTRGGPGQWSPDGRPEHLRRALEGSLKRLRLERIDLYQLHRIDPKVPMGESLGALLALQREGKIRHIGVSNFSVAELRGACERVKVVSVQNRYSVVDRHSDDVLDECGRLGLAFIPWFPLGAGDLGGSGVPAGAPDRKAIETIASRRGASSHQVAIAWLLQRAGNVLPIPGTSSVKHLEENMAAARLELQPDDLRLLDGKN